MANLLHGSDAIFYYRMKKDLLALTILIGILAFAVYFVGTWRLSSPVPIETATTTTGNSTPETTPNIPTEPSEVTIMAKINKPASGLGVTIAPMEVVEDSRCPVDENIRCIQAGTVRVSAKITSGLGKGEIIFKLNTPITTEAERVELIQVLPDARAEVPIVINEYRFIFKITKRVI